MKIENRTLNDFRTANCKAASCEECETNRLCLLYCFFSARDEGSRTNIEVVTKVLEDNGFHVTDIREERARSTDHGHVIDDCGINPTGAILFRAVPVHPESGEGRMASPYTKQGGGNHGT
jgi:hypothetical protein